MSAQPDARKRRSPQKKSGGGMAIFLFVVMPLALFALPTAMVVAAGMVPTVVAYIVDRDPDKTAPVTVGALNACGVLPFVMELWKHQHTMQAAGRMLTDPLTWLVMYGAAAAGWAFYYMIPPVIMGLEVMRSEARIESLLGKRLKLIEEWGPEVTLDDEALAEMKAKAEGKVDLKPDAKSG